MDEQSVVVSRSIAAATISSLRGLIVELRHQGVIEGREAALNMDALRQTFKDDPKIDMAVYDMIHDSVMKALRDELEGRPAGPTGINPHQ